MADSSKSLSEQQKKLALEQTKKEMEKEASRKRNENSGKKGIPFGGTISDMGSKDAVGVGLGK